MKKNKMTVKQIRQISESGRSLIEMLAVLAIIGVLVVLGLNLYWYARNRQQTNALKAGLSTMAATTSIKLSTSSDFKIYGNLKYPYEGKFNDNKTFTITVSDIPQEICTRLKSERWSLPSKTEFNGSETGRCIQKNVLAFHFNNSLFDGRHPELESSSSSSVPQQTGDLCNPCQKGCSYPCKGKNYWAWSDGWACFNEAKNPPYCNIFCSQPLVQITNCDGTTRECCPDNENDCSEPQC